MTTYQVDHQWAYSLMDSSRISTFVISILLIVYGSFRSLNMEQEAREREKEKERSNLVYDSYRTLNIEQEAREKEKKCGSLLTGMSNNNGTRNADGANRGKIKTLNTKHALCLPFAASVSLLVMFFFFDSMQMLVTICMAIIATVALAFLLLPMCQYIIKPCSDGNKISFGICGRCTGAELLSFSLSVSIVCIWVLTGHWLLMDAMAMGLCVAFIAVFRLPSLKVSTLLLTGLLIYDVFWVFFSSYIFSTNVMIKVATRPADNPVSLVARKLHLSGIAREAPKLHLPAKFVFPSMYQAGHFSMLGLGDVVIPGFLLCFVLRYDAYKKSQFLPSGCEAGVPPPRHFSRISYFHCSLIGYFLGLLTATVSAEVFKAAQPALLYLVPFTLLPLLTMAYLKGDLRRMWSEPFSISPQPSKHMEI